jgi:hypothetical protein
MKRGWLSITLTGALLAGAGGSLYGACGPFTDVAADAFCSFVFEVFALGITTGTTATTYDPTGNVSRLQMAAFLSRSVDGTLRRGGKRAALNQFWNTGGAINLGITTVGFNLNLLQSDGTDIWAADNTAVQRLRGGDGRVLETWTGTNSAYGVLVSMGRVFASGQSNPGKLYRIEPAQPAGAVTTVATNLGANPAMMAFDGSRIWTANLGAPGSVSFVTPTASLPWTVTTVTGFIEAAGILYDGSNIWITDLTAGTLLKLDGNAAVLQTVTVGSGPKFPIYDGSNIWVPNIFDASVTVVRASNGAVLATLTGNGLSLPNAAAFDGQRILVTNSADKVSLWKAADFTPLGSIFTGASSDPVGACSDGVSFWIGLSSPSRIARF